MHGGYLHIQPGRGKKVVSCQERNEHNNDTASALNLFSKWIEQTALSENETTIANLLKELVKVFNNITQTTNVQTTNVQTTNIQRYENESFTVLSSFLIKIAFKIKKINITKEAQAIQLKEPICKDFEEILAHSILNVNLNSNKIYHQLKSPNHLAEYYIAMPSSLLNVFIDFISVLKERKR